MRNPGSEIQLSYKVRGNGLPQGKPRIYFTCHPDDMAAYFDKVSSDLLQRINCAVWFKQNPNEYYSSIEEMQVALGQMQLFVIPVTTRLLTLPNPAMDQEYVYAVNHHIPVLPLMEEEKIDDLYSRRFGNIQYLAPNLADPTAISYDEKITRFLNQTLIGDDTAKLVRAAFDAYIFLSYRKKDRQQALQLMKLIHKNKLCESIAIWYDEYLVPNENFNNAIQDALTKSNLFALLVTPNLVNEPNYIMKVEYPTAKQAGKKIFPVETQETDRHALEEFYDGIPACVRLTNEQEFSESLLDSLKSIAITERSAEPEHNFFIGLAYLDGIDVEVDHEKALRLIKGAADQGLEEAIEQLASMYAEGKGVPRSEELSLSWRKKLVETLRTKQDISKLCTAMQAYADACCDMGRYTDAGVMMKEMIEIVESLPEDYLDKKMILAVGFDILSTCAYQLGFYDDADDMNLRAAQLRFGDNLAEAKWTRKTFPYLYDHFNRFAASYDRRGISEKALEYYGYAKMILSELRKHHSINDIDRRTSAAYLLMQSGMIENKRANYEAAREKVKKSVRIYAQLAQENPSFLFQRNVMMSIGLLGEIERNAHQYNLAKEYFEYALNQAENLFKETGAIQSQSDMATFYQAIAEIEITIGHITEAHTWADRFMINIEKVYKAIDSKSCSEDYARSFILHARILIAEGITDDAEKALSEAETILKKIYTNHPGDLEAGGLLATINYLLGDALLFNKQSNSAEHYYKAALEYINEIKPHAENPSSVESDESAILERLGNIAKLKDNILQAKQLFEEALTLRRKIASQSMAPSTLEGLWTLRQSLGDIAYSMNDNSTAYKYYSEGLTVAESVMQSTDNPLDLKALVVMYERMGMVEQAAGNVESAQEYYQKMQDMSLRISKSTEGSVTVTADLCRSYKRIGEIALEKGSLSEAKNAFETMHSIAQSLIKQYGETGEARDVLSFSDALLSKVLKELDELVLAEKYLREGISIREDLANDSHTMDDQYILFDLYFQLIEILSLKNLSTEIISLEEKMISIARKMYVNAVSLPMRSCLYRALLMAAAIAQDYEEHEKALKYYNEAIISIENLLVDFPNDELRLALSIACYGCALIESEFGKKTNAADYFKRAVQQAKTIKLKTLSSDSQLSIAQVYYDFADFLDKEKNHNSASTYYDRSHSIAMHLLNQKKVQIDAGLIAIRCDVIQGARATNNKNIKEAVRRFKQGNETCDQILRVAPSQDDIEDLQRMKNYILEQLEKWT